MSVVKKVVPVTPDTSSRKRKLKVDVLDPGKDHKRSKPTVEYTPEWSQAELLAEQQGIDGDTAVNIIELLEEGNTIPFIARYRRHLTKNMTPEALRNVKDAYDEISTLKSKIGTILKNLDKAQLLNSNIRQLILSARSLEELEYVYAPYKPGSKRSLAEKAIEIGLEKPALTVLNNHHAIDLTNYVDGNIKELSDITAVIKGIVHIIASIIAKDSEVLSFLREIRNETNFIIKSRKLQHKTKINSIDESKFVNYHNFEIPVKYIKPHQVLAMNRGENLKILSVELVVPDLVSTKYSKFCMNKWFYNGKSNLERQTIIQEAIADSYKRLVRPWIIREVRSGLKLVAERASCEVFSANLKQLLLSPPLKGRSILGMDPGFSNGCKLALVSPTGVLITSHVIYPHQKSNSQASKILKEILSSNGCELIALGNGKGCRQTEEWLSGLLKMKIFDPLDVKYVIVNEDGASIYSCSDEAKLEFPNLDPNIISAVSLARRLQDPLAELVKIEPKHLGVGQYQHDLKKKSLEEALNQVVSECVSFVGVDLNTTSHCLLKYIAGLSDKRAEQIIKYREKNGRFVSRNQLLDVPGIGKVIFKQCAGFIRVTNEDYNDPQSTKLDSSDIHPESYSIARKLIDKFQLSVCDIGQSFFINSVKSQFKRLNLVEFSKELNCSHETVNLIVESLCKPLNYDLRCEIDQKLFYKKGLTSIDDIKIGMEVIGCVNNVTSFGSFLDIGVGVNGLVHISKYSGFSPQIGDRFECKILDVDSVRKRISLQTLKKV